MQKTGFISGLARRRFLDYAGKYRLHQWLSKRFSGIAGHTEPGLAGKSPGLQTI
jgi:hypothetical protein